jgi:15-cis-phytoene synthase
MSASPLASRDVALAPDRPLVVSARALPPIPERHAAATADSAVMMARVARSFWAAARFLPAAVRSDVVILYAVCRTIDDAVDEAPDDATARAELARMQAELTGEAPLSPLFAAYHAVAARHRIPVECALLLIDGVRSDLGPVRIIDEDDLVRYCYRVASTVGLMMSHVVGCDDPLAPPFAVDLGLAMQLTNIVRDVAEDAQRDRVYYPGQMLAEYGANAEQIRRGTIDRAVLRELTLRVLALADRYYRSAEEGMRYIPARCRVGVLVASRLYAAIGRRVRRVGHDPLDGRMIVPRYEKAIWAAAGLGASVTPRALGFGAARTHDAALHRAIAGWPGANPRA